jgi:hypothetical protein
MSMPTKMSLQTLVTVCSRLVNQKQMHRESAIFFNSLFNQQVPPEFSEKLAYSGLQRFYQLRAEYHASQMLRIDAEIEKLDGFANSDLFPAE